MLTLEDYKVLATLLKEKQKRKSEISEQEKVTYEQNKFSQIREAYRSVR